MNIYIPDIKLPKDEPGAFQVIVMYVGADRKLRAECEGTHEVVSVPPHGRTIDVDALWVEINKICDRRDAGIISDLTCLQQLLSAVRHAPTIIPAEPLNEEVNE